MGESNENFQFHFLVGERAQTVSSSIQQSIIHNKQQRGLYQESGTPRQFSFPFLSLKARKTCKANWILDFLNYRITQLKTEIANQNVKNIK